MKISVVIPTYNRPQLLRLCLEALLQQDFDKGEYEIIIVTDGPDEQTRLLVQSYKQDYIQPHIYCLSLPQKKGPAAARNSGWQQAAAPLIAFTDDDTQPQHQWLKVYSNAYYGEAAIAFTGKVIVPHPQPPTDYEKNIAHLETADFITANCCCTKAALQQVGGFDEAYKTAWREDSDLHFKLLQARVPIKHMESAAILHPVRTAKWGVSIQEQKKSLYNALLYKKFPELYRQKIMRQPVWNYYLIITVFITGIIFLLCKQNITGIILLSVWLIQTLHFAFRRLSSTSHTARHIAEMLATSAIIPFLSVYWTLYGAYRFKVFFL